MRRRRRRSASAAQPSAASNAARPTTAAPASHSELARGGSAHRVAIRNVSSLPLRDPLAPRYRLAPATRVRLRFLSSTSSSEIAAGVMPEMRAAWPMSFGRMRASFSRSSFESPLTSRVIEILRQPRAGLALLPLDLGALALDVARVVRVDREAAASTARRARRRARRAPANGRRARARPRRAYSTPGRRSNA